jgi:hypothetical protein
MGQKDHIGAQKTAKKNAVTGVIIVYLRRPVMTESTL